MKTTKTESKESGTQAARRYIARGWKPLAVSRGHKGPTDTDWPKWVVGNAHDYIKEHFRIPLPNIALQMGSKSGGLTDVDLDCREAVALANDFDFLPKTPAVFGRKSKRRSHYPYITDLHETERKASLSYAEGAAMLVELRVGGKGKGAASLVPPSVHPSGEEVTWDEDGDPAAVVGDDLKRRVALLAAAALLVRHYPMPTKRHIAMRVLGGVLARAQWKADDIAWFVGAVAAVAGDNEERNDRIEAAASAVELLAEGDDAPGLPRMREEWGDEVATLFAEWISYDGNGTPDHTPREQDRAGDADTQTDQLLARINSAVSDDASLSRLDSEQSRETAAISSCALGSFST